MPLCSSGCGVSCWSLSIDNGLQDFFIHLLGGLELIQVGLSLLLFLRAQFRAIEVGGVPGDVHLDAVHLPGELHGIFLQEGCGPVTLRALCDEGVLPLELAGLREGAQLFVAELQADGLAYKFGYELCIRFLVIEALFSLAEPAAQIDRIREDRVRSPDERIVQVFPMDAGILFNF